MESNSLNLYRVQGLGIPRFHFMFHCLFHSILHYRGMDNPKTPFFLQLAPRSWGSESGLGSRFRVWCLGFRGVGFRGLVFRGVGI